MHMPHASYHPPTRFPRLTLGMTGPAAYHPGAGWTGDPMRIALLIFALVFAAAAQADESDLHRAAVLDTLLRQLAPEHRAGVVFVRMRERCWHDETRGEGCVDLPDEVLDRLRRQGHNVSRVPEASRYYIYGPPSSHADEFNPPPPDWLYLPIHTPAAEWRTYCEVELKQGLYSGDARHINGRCFAADREVRILASGDFLVREDGRAMTVEPYVAPTACILPAPPPDQE